MNRRSLLRSVLAVGAFAALEARAPAAAGRETHSSMDVSASIEENCSVGVGWASSALTRTDADQNEGDEGGEGGAGGSSPASIPVPTPDLDVYGPFLPVEPPAAPKPGDALDWKHGQPVVTVRVRLRCTAEANGVFDLMSDNTGALLRSSVDPSFVEPPRNMAYFRGQRGGAPSQDLVADYSVPERLEASDGTVWATLNF